MKKKLYPLKFVPVLRQVVWGGGALVRDYGRVIPSGEDGRPVLDPDHIAESWDISGIGERPSVVSEGFLAENDLPDILETYMGDLVGDEVFDRYNLLFPLLIKTLDVEDRLSVQVHPDDEVAVERYDSLGKAEFWYVMDASPGAEVYMGFERDTSAREFYDACKSGTAQNLLNVYHPVKGDCFFIKPGTVHAATGGIVIAEIQESSDMTFRLYDWGRELNPATARPIHLDDALDIINFSMYDEAECRIHCPSHPVTLAECRQFVIDSVPLAGEYRIDVDQSGSFIICICTEGSAVVEVCGSPDGLCRIGKGESVLIPASLDEVAIRGNGHLLQVHVPHYDEPDNYIDG